MASSRFWYVLSLVLACPPNSDATSTLKDLKLKQRRRMKVERMPGGAAPSSYSYGGQQDSYGTYGASYGGGGNAMKNLFGNSYGGSGKSYSYSYSYSYGDDEFSCLVDPKNASTKGFLCSDGVSCIQGPKSCDGTPDCPDHSDELGCDFECLLKTGSMTGFRCHDGSCAEGGPDGRRMCDGKSDCADGSDELGCGFECVLPHGGRGIECSNGQCIHESYACDGEANCPDGSDEMGCAFQCTTSENIKGWFCSDGTCHYPYP